MTQLGSWQQLEALGFCINGNQNAGWLLMPQRCLETLVRTAKSIHVNLPEHPEVQKLESLEWFSEGLQGLFAGDEPAAGVGEPEWLGRIYQSLVNAGEVKGLWWQLSNIAVYKLALASAGFEAWLVFDDAVHAALQRKLKTGAGAVRERMMDLYRPGQSAGDPSGAPVQVRIYDSQAFTFGHTFIPKHFEIDHHKFHTALEQVTVAAGVAALLPPGHVAAQVAALTSKGKAISFWYIVHGAWGESQPLLPKVLKELLTYFIADLHRLTGLSLGRISFKPLAVPTDDNDYYILSYRVKSAHAKAPALSVCLPLESLCTLFESILNPRLLEMLRHNHRNMLLSLFSLNALFSKLAFIRSEAMASNIESPDESLHYDKYFGGCISLASFVMNLDRQDLIRLVSAMLGVGNGLSDIPDYFLEPVAIEESDDAPAQYEYLQQAAFDERQLFDRLGVKWGAELQQHWSKRAGRIRSCEQHAVEFRMKQQELLVVIWQLIAADRLSLSIQALSMLETNFITPLETQSLERLKVFCRRTLEHWLAQKPEKRKLFIPSPFCFIPDPLLLKTCSAALDATATQTIQEELLIWERKLKQKQSILPWFNLWKKLSANPWSYAPSGMSL